MEYVETDIKRLETDTKRPTTTTTKDAAMLSMLDCFSDLSGGNRTGPRDDAPSGQTSRRSLSTTMKATAFMIAAQALPKLDHTFVCNLGPLTLQKVVIVGAIVHIVCGLYIGVWTLRLVGNIILPLGSAKKLGIICKNT